SLSCSASCLCVDPCTSGFCTLSLHDALPISVLTLSYCLGLGIPFTLVALLLIRGGGRMKWVKEHHAAITRVGGAVLVGVGLLLVTGVWTQWVNGLQGLIGGFSTVV